MRKLLKLVGPYPYNPYLIFLFSFSIYFARFLPTVSNLPPGPERFQAGGIMFVASAFPAAVLSSGVILLRKYRFWSSRSLLLYIFEIAFFHLLNLFYLSHIDNFLLARLGLPEKNLFALSPSIFVVSLILVLIASALMHQADRRIGESLQAATELVRKLKSERESLIHYDEQLRLQTSHFLHDRVQSDLMVVGMKLKSITGKSSVEVNEVLDRAILRLENTRASDLKNLIQILTPNLDSGGLHAAIDALREQYGSSMEIAIEIDAATEDLPADVLLGIFRIVEQSVLNALVHGPANHVQINVTTDTMGVTDIIISDDGPGTSVEAVIPGLGASIIDSWVGILNGSKEIDSAPGHGYQLHVTFMSP